MGGVDQREQTARRIDEAILDFFNLEQGKMKPSTQEKSKKEKRRRERSAMKRYLWSGFLLAILSSFSSMWRYPVSKRDPSFYLSRLSLYLDTYQWRIVMYTMHARVLRTRLPVPSARLFFLSWRRDERKDRWIDFCCSRFLSLELFFVKLQVQSLSLSVCLRTEPMMEFPYIHSRAVVHMYAIYIYVYIWWESIDVFIHLPLYMVQID